MTTTVGSTPRALAIASTFAAMGALIVLGFDAAFLVFGWVLGFLFEGTSGSSYEAVVRLAGASGVVGTLAALPFARPLLRVSQRSVWLAGVLLVIGVAGMFLLFPRTFVYVGF